MEAQGKRHLELGTVLDGRYIIEEILGEGGFESLIGLRTSAWEFPLR